MPIKKKQPIHLPRTIYQNLRSDILSAVIPPGTCLNERAIAEERGVSRTPVREALFLLESEHLVRRYPKLGVVVTELSLRDVVEAFQIREFIEPPAAAIAAEHSGKLADELTNLLREFEYLPGSGLEDKEKYLRHNAIDGRLHELILESVGNLRLTDIMNTIQAICTRARSFGTPMRFDESTLEHTRLIQALLDGDAAASALCMRTHLVNTRKRLMPS